MTIRELCALSLLFGLGTGTVIASNFFVPGKVAVGSLSEQTSPLVPQTTTCKFGIWPDCTRTIATDTNIDTPPAELTSTSFVSDFGLEAQFSIGQHYTYTDGLVVTLTEIHDSRCPQQAQCIWAGELSPQLKVTGGAFGTSVVTLLLGSDRTKEITQGAYTFSLTHTSEGEARLIITRPSQQKTTLSASPLATPTPKTTPTLSAVAIQTKPPTAHLVSETDIADEVALLIEKATTKLRKNESLPSFTRDAQLASSARTYSHRLRVGNFLAHVDSQGCDLTCRFTASGYLATTWGENLAMMTFEEQPAAAYIANYFMTQWLKSAGHRKNLLSPTFSHQGIGVSYDNDSIYVVVHFALPEDSE